jgi:hypothetical protein
MTAEHQRLAVNAAKKIPLEQWGPYLSDRQWGTVREDYSSNGDAWNYLLLKHPITGPIAGAKMAWPAYPIFLAISALHYHSGMAKTIFSKKNCTGWAITKAIMEKT